MADAAPSAPSLTSSLKPTSSSPGAFTMAPMVRHSDHKRMKALFYGPHGAGKTTLCGSAVDVPEMRDVLVITAEGGTVVFEDNDRIVESEFLDVVKIDRIEQFQKVYDFLKTHIAWRDDPSKEKNLMELQQMVGLPGDRVRRFRTCIVDSLSEIEAMNLAKILNLDAQGMDAGDDMEVAGFPQFRKNNHIMQRIVRQYRDLDIHVLFTCAQGYTQDERKAYHYSPKLTGQLTGIIQGFFDVVGWLVPASSIDEKTGAAPRRLFVQPQSAPKADAKCRLASYKSPFFDDPTMTNIMVATGFIKKPKA
jgi:GTPase SAR1 family protein